VLPRSAAPADPLEKEEIYRARIHLLLQRYGVLFRELLGREPSGWRWGDVFPSLRLMELSGEIFSGHFFQGIPGLQFISPEAFRMLSGDLDEDAVFWISSLDPVSPCGLGLEAFKGEIPKRLAGNHLVYHGSRLVLISRSYGRNVTLRTTPDHPAVPRYLKLFPHLLSHPDHSLKLLRVAKINGEPALKSPYRQALSESGFVEDYRCLVLRARYR
jgi:ATP-dependent Lhr-like helicase